MIDILGEMLHAEYLPLLREGRRTHYIGSVDKSQRNNDNLWHLYEDDHREWVLTAAFEADDDDKLVAFRGDRAREIVVGGSRALILRRVSDQAAGRQMARVYIDGALCEVCAGRKPPSPMAGRRICRAVRSPGGKERRPNPHPACGLRRHRVVQPVRNQGLRRQLEVS